MACSGFDLRYCLAHVKSVVGSPLAPSPLSLNLSSANFMLTKLTEKARSCFLQAGRSLLVQAFTVWFTLNDPRTPEWAKTLIMGALAYLLLPTDSIPDFIPVGGYVDDAAAISAVVATISTHITDDHRAQAETLVSTIHG